MLKAVTLSLAVVLMASMLTSCDRTTHLSMSNCSGKDLEVFLYTNDNFMDRGKEFSLLSDNVFRTKTIRYNEKIEFSNLVIGELDDDLPFDSLIIVKFPDDTTRYRAEQVMNNLLETDLSGGTAVPYSICLQ